MEQREAVLPFGCFAQGVPYAVGKFIGAGRGHHHHGTAVIRALLIGMGDRPCYRGVGIHDVAVCVVDLLDRRFRLSVVRPIRPEIVLHPLNHTDPAVIAPLLCQVLHPLAHHGGIAGQVVEEPLQIAGNQDVHGRRNGFEEGAVPVVIASEQEIRQHVILIGRADKPPDGKPHLPCVESGQDVAKVPRGDCEIHCIAVLDPP